MVAKRDSETKRPTIMTTKTYKKLSLLAEMVALRLYRRSTAGSDICIQLTEREARYDVTSFARAIGINPR